MMISRHKAIIQFTLLHRCEGWIINKWNKRKIKGTDRKILRIICGGMKGVWNNREEE